MKILIADKISKEVESILNQDFEVVTDTGNDEASLISKILDYNGIIIRSDTKVTRKVFEAAKNLKVVGRAGIGVDNVDLEAATEYGVVVMNTPFGNSVTTAEHAITLMLTQARKITEADSSMKAGKWNKSALKGVEISGKILGMIGCGNIGSIVANRAQGLHMRVMVYDPFFNEEAAKKLGVERVELDQVLRESDFITIHTPLTDETRGLVGRENLAKMKSSAFLVNCARGGIVDEVALIECLNKGGIKSAALDVFEKEPLAEDHPLRKTANLVLTPHLGASTAEAQEKVAIQVAEQFKNYFLNNEVVNAVNTVSISKKDYAVMSPYLSLIHHLGSFLGQLTNTGIKSLEITYCGEVSTFSTKALTLRGVCSLLRSKVESVNVINSLIVAKSRGVKVSERHLENEKISFNSLITIEVETEANKYRVSGSLFGNKPQIVSIDGVNLNVTLGRYNLFIANQDKPGLVKEVAEILADQNVNIGTFHLGRNDQSGEAITVITMDDKVALELIAKITAIEWVSKAKYIVVD